MPEYAGQYADRDGDAGRNGGVSSPGHEDAKLHTLQEIMEKDLLFLISFYIFIHEKQLKAYENDAARLDELKEEYRQIAGWLEQKAERGQISVFTCKTLIDMTGKVLDNIAARYEKIREEVRTVMGGKILEYEAKTILRAGFQEGRQEGRLESLLILF